MTCRKIPLRPHTKQLTTATREIAKDSSTLRLMSPLVYGTSSGTVYSIIVNTSSNGLRGGLAPWLLAGTPSGVRAAR